jgi:endonuclease-8
MRGGAIEAVQWNGPVLTLETRAVLRLGPDLLADTTNPTELVRRLRRGAPERPLGEVLQDQRLVAGIGNMWMSEALWAAGLSPWLPLASVDDAELHAALTWARETMRSAVIGSRPQRSVYRRAGRPCRRCSELIRARGQGDANRTAYWCPGCQRGPSPRP